MKKILIITLLLIVAAGGLYASDSFSAGFEIGELGPDLVMGVRITSPWLFDGYAAARISGDLAFNVSTLWSPYGVFRAGLIGSSGMVNDTMRLYGEGGGMLLWNEDSAGSLVLGGYGLFGFEFFTGVDSPVAYFIEAGTNGSSLSRLTGFDIKTGLSVYF
ncbi:MAG: hypothetical protein JEZ04_15350 [Spirochaetales bacterium]|nr:hypothetical protein [Spirochaetales bacterium]